jgi:drug/metabolite transporter (DMT)-like permease
MNINKITGAALIILSSMAYGAMPVMVRLAYADGASTFTVLFLRFSIAAVFMLGIMAASRTAFPRGKMLLALVLLGTIGYVAQSLSYYLALSMASASLIALLLYLFPILVTAVSTLVFHEPLTRVKVVALVIALSGAALTIGPAGSGSWLGIGMGLVNAVAYGVYILVSSRLLRSIPPLPASAVIILSAGVVYTGMAAAQGFRFPAHLSGWAAIIGLATVSTVLAIGLFLAGLQRIGPTTAAILGVVEPATAVLLAVLVLGESLSAGQVAGGALILSAVVLSAR